MFSYLIVSSPAFVEEYFKKYHLKLPKIILVENKVVLRKDLESCEPSTPDNRKDIHNPKITIGWFGILRCQRSLDMFVKIAETFPLQVDIVLRGRPSLTAVPDFSNIVDQHKNIQFKGAYSAPADLQDIYSEIDMMWAGDFSQDAYNSKWLLPNRLYEAGFHSVPCVALDDSETGNWILQHKTGFYLPNPIEDSFVDLLQSIISDRNILVKCQTHIMSLPRNYFADQPDFMKSLLNEIYLNTQMA